MTYETFNRNSGNHLKEPMFLGSGNGIARYDSQKYPFFEKLIEKQLSFFWRPEEVNLEKDSRDWSKLNYAEQHIFISNLKRQIVLDTVQGRSPAIAFLPIVSIPELETWVETWGANETVHSRSYTHIIRNLFTEPDKIFDDIVLNDNIISSATQMTKYYDDLINYNTKVDLYGYGEHKITINGKKENLTLTRLEHLKKIYLAIANVNILEGIRFYVSFACSWAFNERELMEGNSKIITLICRDENLHLSGTQFLLNIFENDLRKAFSDISEEDFNNAIEECKQQVIIMFDEVVADEKKWADYLFKEDSMIGLNAKLLKNFVEYIANNRLKAIGFEPRYETKENPLDWVNKYIQNNSKGQNDVQVAPQESEISSYLIGQVNNDINDDSFQNFSLD